MAIIITDDCINCGACEPECPNTAIYEAAVNWKYSDGTSLRGEVNLLDGKIVSAEVPQTAVNDEVYYIVPDKCTCLLYTSPSPRDRTRSRMPSSA